MNEYKKTVFENGIRLITAPLTQSETATILVLFATGSRYEDKKINGMSHFLEHMFFKGTEKRPTTLDITKELDGLGAEFNAFTGKDHTGYYVKVANQHLPVAIDVVSDMLLNSKFDEKELEKEKGVIVEEINMYEDNPLMYIGDIYEEEMYKDSKLGYLISGPRKTVRAVTRSMMVDYKNSHYRGENTVIAVAGKLNPDVESQIQDAFAPLKGNAQENFFNYEKFVVDQTKPRVRLLYRKSEQAQLAFGFSSYSYSHPDLVISKLLAIILGGNMSSRLFISVREQRGLAYMVRSDTNEYQDVGNFLIHAGLDKARIMSAIEVIKDELETIKKTSITDQELKRAKDYLQGKKSIAFENTSVVANWYAGQEVLLNRIETPDHYFKKVQSVTVDDIERVANDLFDYNKSTLAVIGPYKNDGEFYKLF